MARAQGSLEYLILIAVVLGIITVVILIVTGYMGSQQSTYSINNCKNTAATCKVYLSVNQLDTCNACDTACIASDGTEVSTNAIECCKLGLPNGIYVGATGSECQAGVTCINNQTQSCITTDGCPGNETCSGGVWSACVKNDPNCPIPGTFKKILVETVSSGNGAGPLAIADVNNDGKKEIVIGVGSGLSITHKAADAIDVYSCAGTSCSGGRAFTQSFPSLAVGDVNYIPPSEILLGVGCASGRISIYSYPGWATTCVNTTGMSWPPDAIAIGDADYNGLNDVVANDPSNYYLRMFSYDAITGAWVGQVISTNSGIGLEKCAIGDVDNQTGNEVVCGGYSDVRVYTKGMSGWTSTTITGGGVKSLAIGDVDNDGQNEIVVGRGTPSLFDVGTELQVFKFVNSAWQAIYSKNYGCGGGAYSIYGLAIGDVDSQPGNELIVGLSSQACSGVNELDMHKYSAGTWSVTTIDNATGIIYDVAIGNANNVGKDDIVISRTSTSAVYMYTID